MCVSVPCTDKLGLENGDIPDANLEASDSSSNSYGPHQARLNGQYSWGVSRSISNPWIQVNIGYSANVTGLLTQGHPWNSNWENWITKLKVSTFTAANDDQEVFIEDENGVDKVVIRL